MMRALITLLSLFLVCVNQLSWAQETTEADSLDEYHVFMLDLIDQLNIGLYDEFFEAVDFDAIIETATKDIPLPEVDKRSLIAGMKSGADSQFRTNYSYMFDNTELIQYVNYFEEGEFYIILVRFSGSNGLNYIEFKLDKNSEGEISIVDYYPYITGEYVSSTLGRMVKIIYSAQEENFLSALISGASTKEKEFTQSLPKLIEIQNNVRLENYDEAKKIYDSLPESVQNNKIFIISIMQVAQNTEGNFYLDLIDRYARYYPEDPSLPLIALDSYLLRGNIEGAQRQINILDEAVGGDNYLNVMRGNIAVMGGDIEAGRSYFNRALTENRYVEDAYWGLIEICLAEKDFESIIKHLNNLIELFGYSFSETDFQYEIYTEFSDSEEFRKWINEN